MEQSSLFGDGVDIDAETPASADATAPTDARARAAARAVAEPLTLPAMADRLLTLYRALGR